MNRDTTPVTDPWLLIEEQHEAALHRKIDEEFVARYERHLRRLRWLHRCVALVALAVVVTTATSFMPTPRFAYVHGVHAGTPQVAYNNVQQILTLL